MVEAIEFDIDSILVELARREMRYFVEAIDSNYIFKAFNLYIMERLDAFARGEIKCLMIWMPPQHGKSQLTSRITPAKILGINPKKKIGITSFSATVAHEFARDAKNIIQSPEYKAIYPDTKVGRDKVYKQKDAPAQSLADTSYYYQTPQKGGVYATGVCGPLTSKTIDIMIYDDLYKDRAAAMSLKNKNSIKSWFYDVSRTRQHNDSQELYVTTRWTEDDLAGHLMKTEKDKWEVIIFPAIKTEDYCPYDNREPGEALFPEKHNHKRLLEAKKANEVSFNALYQQDPKPNKELLVHDFKKVGAIPYELINKWVLGLDYGWNDPVALVAIGTYENKRYWRTLIYEPGKDIVEKLKIQVGNRHEDEAQKIITGAISDTIVQAIKAAGLWGKPIYCEHVKALVAKLQFNGAPALLANKSVNEGLVSVNEKDNYYLDTDEYLHNEVTKYQWQTVGELILETPVDGNDHLLNAGRYAIHTDSIMNPWG